jgi:hypothetical protein
MIEFLRRFFMDERQFVVIMRGLLIGVGGLQVSGGLPDALPAWVGAFAMAAGGMMRSSPAAPKG